MNSLLGQKVSIVTNKPQTTRHKILGILSKESYQIVFFDTPGLMKPKYLLHEAMLNSARSAIADADVLLYMVDATTITPGMLQENDPALSAVASSSKPAYLIINKIDLIDKHRLLPIIASTAEKHQFKEVFPISALKQFGLADLERSIAGELPEHAPYYPTDIVSEHPERFFVSEIVREKIFEQFKAEIPYSTTVDIIEFTEQTGKKDVIQAEIIVERESQKGILIGKGGLALKEVGEEARKDIEAFLGRPVFLALHVKVREKWREKEAWLKRFGY